MSKFFSIYILAEMWIQKWIYGSDLQKEPCWFTLPVKALSHDTTIAFPSRLIMPFSDGWVWRKK
jgi:hypothetical protein